jgi:hypothetical protein
MAGKGGGEGGEGERGEQDVLMGDGVGVQDEIWPVRQGGTSDEAGIAAGDTYICRQQFVEESKQKEPKEKNEARYMHF